MEANNSRITSLVSMHNNGINRTLHGHSFKEEGSKEKIVNENESVNGSTSVKRIEPSCNWVSIKRILIGSARWSGSNKWEERNVRATPLLRLQEGCEGGGVRWQSPNSELPVWQRPILKGEKCELPRFSGLILYDERGKLLDHFLKETSHKDDIHQESAAVVRITLRDLL